MIQRELCQRVLQRAAATGADYAELFAEHTVNHTVHMIDAKVDAVNDAVVAGVGIRVFKGLRSVSASTVDTSETGLMRCADAAAAALGEGTAEIDIVLHERSFGDIHPVKIVPSSVPNARKIAILKDAYFAASDYDEAISQVSGTLLDVDHKILIANSEGLYTQDRQIRTRLAITAIAEKNGETRLLLARTAHGSGDVRQRHQPAVRRPRGRASGDGNGLGRLLPGGRHARGHRQRLWRRYLPRGLRP